MVLSLFLSLLGAFFCLHILYHVGVSCLLHSISCLSCMQGSQMEPSAVAQRELLLNVLLHYNMVGVIVATIRDWADGKYSKVNSYF